MNNTNNNILSDEITILIEIPKGSRNKYEVDHDSGHIFLDRYLFTSTQYPTDYGSVPNSLADDGDPIDAFVLLDEPTFPGCHIKARIVGMIEMTDEAGGDEKLLCVPATDPRWEHIKDIDDVEDHLLNEISHFLKVYKALEPGKHSEIGNWQPKDVALIALQKALSNFKG